MAILINAEHDGKLLNPVTRSTLTAAQQLQQNITLLVVGYNCQKVAEQAAKLEGIEQVLLADHESYRHHLAENVAQLIQGLAQDYACILAPASTFGKNLMPRVAGLLDIDMIADVVEVIDDHTFIRPIYAGNALEKITTNDPIKIVTIRASAFDKSDKPRQSPAPIVACDQVISNDLSEFVSVNLSQSERPDLATAKIVISGGRGLQNKENFRLIEKLADKLGAAIGASRAAVDAGFISNDYQVGQTGKVVAPELYIAIGISGAIQHIAGMRNSKVIVAINRDPEAPIFEIADYGLVGDLFSIIPEFEAALDELKVA